jgi:hypothetical protein
MAQEEKSDLFSSASSSEDGWLAYQQEQEAHFRTIRNQLGLPIGRRVDVQLLDGRSLTGLLTLDEPDAYLVERHKDLRLRIGRYPFIFGKVVSCLQCEKA